MKYITLILILLASTVSAAEISFSWLPNSESDLAGYKIYYGENVADCGLPETVDGRVQCTVESGDSEETYYATAYDMNGNESEPSNTLTVDPAPSAPGDLQSVTVNVTVNIN